MGWIRVVSMLARLILGFLFIYASIEKIIHPGQFAEVIHNYQILPDLLINPTAIILPWLELILGAFLLIGIWLPGAVFLTNLLLVLFLGAMVFNLTRGLDIHCGCFSTTVDLGDAAAPMVWYVIRDSLFIVPGIFLLWHTLHYRETAKAIE
ncbi:MAG: DoxX family membrane protein [Deltaproteobacteria bacterium]|nr:DoxX family membrane protein [Deltaproteobacteria bacterium]